MNLNILEYVAVVRSGPQTFREFSVTVTLEDVGADLARDHLNHSQCPMMVDWDS